MSFDPTTAQESLGTLAEEVVKNLVLVAVPEKRDQLLEMWDAYAPQFGVEHDKTGFNLDASGWGLIKFTTRSMSHLWLLSNVVQRGFSDFSGDVFLSILLAEFDPATLLSSSKEYGRLLGVVGNLGNIEKEADFMWPNTIPRPERGRPADSNGAMAFDLACLATAAAFLHEVEHVKVGKDRVAVTPHEEELRCDRFAQGTLLEGVDVYASASRYPAALVRSKRAISLSLALLYAMLLTPRNLWGGSASHPSIAARFDNLCSGLSLPENDYFWIYLGSVLLAHFDHLGILPEKRPISSAEDLCRYLLEAIRS